MQEEISIWPSIILSIQVKSILAGTARKSNASHAQVDIAQNLCEGRYSSNALNARAFHPDTRERLSSHTLVCSLE